MSMASRWGRGRLAVAFHRAGGMLKNGSAGIPFHVVRQVRRRRARPQHVAPRRGAHSRIGRGAPVRRWGNTRARGGGASSGAMARRAAEERRRDELGAASGGAGARGRGRSRCSRRRAEPMLRATLGAALGESRMGMAAGGIDGSGGDVEGGGAPTNLRADGRRWKRREKHEPVGIHVIF
jgi:hypothetical protein